MGRRRRALRCGNSRKVAEHGSGRRMEDRGLAALHEVRRPRRAEFWWFVLASAIIAIVLSALGQASAVFLVLYFSYTIAVLIPSIAVAVRRLHDTNRSGWWYLLVLIPIVGAIIFIVFSPPTAPPGPNSTDRPRRRSPRPDSARGVPITRTHLRTCVRAGRGDDPPRRPRLVLRVGRAARRSGAARTARGRRHGRRAGRQLRGQGVRRPHGDGRRQARQLCPARSPCRRGCPPTARRARPCSGCSTTRRRWSRGSPSTRRSSTSAACAGCRARRPRSPPGCAPRCASASGLPITVGVARTKFLAKVASGVAKPDGLLVVPPGAERAFLHPLPVERLWGVGAKTAAKLHARGITTVADVAGVGEGPLVSILGPFAGRHLHALAHNRDPRRVEVGRRRRSIGSQHAIGRSRHGPRDAGRARRRARRHRRQGHSTTARRPPGRAHRRAAAALRRLRPRHAIAHHRRPDGGDGDRPRRGAGAVHRGDADHRRTWE